MSIAVVTSPPALAPSASKQIFVVSGSLVSGTNFRYVADVKSGSTTLARLKCDKVPATGRGFFDVGRVVKTLIVPPKPTLAAGWQNALVVQPYAVTFMSEFGSPPVVATGTTTNVSGYVLQGWQRQNVPFVAATFWTSGSVAQALTNRPRFSVVRPNQNDFISIAAIPQPAPTQLVALVQYPTRSFNVAINVDGQLSAMFNAGPAGLAALTSGQTSDGLPGASGLVTGTCGFRYNVTLFVTEASDTFYRAKGSSVDSWQFEIQPEGRFVSQLVYFRNSLGGVDSYNFTMKNRKTGNINRQTFGKNSDVFGSTTFDAVYYGEFQETYTLQSDWLTAPDSEWLAELVYSPQIWLLIDGVLTEGVVNTSTYQFFQHPQDKLNQLTIEVMVAYKSEVI